MFKGKKEKHDLSEIERRVMHFYLSSRQSRELTRRSGYQETEHLRSILFGTDKRRHPFEDLCRIFGYSVDGSVYGVAEFYVDVNGYTIAERHAQIAEMVLTEAKRCGWTEAYTEEFLHRALSTIMDVNDPRWSHFALKDMRPDRFCTEQK